ncbi:MAG: heavy metal sensor histidine kinase [Burkholderiaceae bacterium]|nr:heavy metal sensor histidine kinase [Burkholderiaceae bacterium]
MRPRSITFRLALFFCAASTAVLIGLGWLVGVLVEQHFVQQDVAELDSKVVLVRSAFARVRTDADLPVAGATLRDALVGRDDLLVAVTGRDGRLLYASASAAARFPAALIGSRPPVDPSARVGPIDWEHDGQSFRGITASASTAMPGEPPAIVAVARDIGHHHAFMRDLWRNLALAIGAGVALTALFGWIAARRGLAPLREMATVTQRVSASRLGERLPAESVPGELADLAAAFNDMLIRLEDSFRRLSEFSSDLAHELRTPISNLMTETQVAISRARSADEYREVLYSNLEEYERLARMTSDMLFLAKADNGLIATDARGLVDLAAEARDVLGFYEALCDERGVTVVLEGAGTVRGDRPMLRRAIGNLLSNAIRHTARGGTIRVTIVANAAGAIELAIENPGETIAAEHLPRLFDRFYRVEAARHSSSDGAGLGLAITRSIVEAHGGTIGVASSDGLTRFTIVLPGEDARTGAA